MSAGNTVVHAKNSPLRVWWRRASWGVLFWHSAAAILCGLTVLVMKGVEFYVWEFGGQYPQFLFYVAWFAGVCWLGASPLSLVIALIRKYRPGIFVAAFPLVVFMVFYCSVFGLIPPVSQVGFFVIGAGCLALVALCPMVCLHARTESKRLWITKLGCPGEKHIAKEAEAESVVINTVTDETAQPLGLHLERHQEP
jgi:hypothetical protein